MKKIKKHLPETHPHLFAQWDWEKNGDLDPYSLTYGSRRKVWWLCEECNHSWKVSIGNRSIGNTPCPKCSIKLRSNRIKRPLTYVKKVFNDKGLNLLESEYKNNKTKMKYKCNVCNYIGHIRLYSLKSDCGCPNCAGQIVTDENNLAVKFPGISAQWHPTKNRDLTPKDVFASSGKSHHWKCDVCYFEWKAAISNRTYGNTGCPKCSKSGVSKASQTWLDALNISTREHYIKDLKIFVDGFNPKTNTVYEFLGDYWHGNPEVYGPGEINPSNKKSYGQLYQETMERFEILKENGYKVVYIWESDFRGIADGTKKVEKERKEIHHR